MSEPKITKCPTAYAGPSSGSISEADRTAIAEHNKKRETRIHEKKLLLRKPSSPLPQGAPLGSVCTTTEITSKKENKDMSLDGRGTTRNVVWFEPQKSKIEIFKGSGYDLVVRHERNGSVWAHQVIRGKPTKAVQFQKAIL